MKDSWIEIWSKEKGLKFTLMARGLKENSLQD